MTTSGDTAYDRTGAQIVKTAYQISKTIGVDEDPSADQKTLALDLLNLMIKTDQTRLGLWRMREAKAFVSVGTKSYSFPPSGNYACDISELSETTLDADEASGQTELSVAATTGFTDNDTILVAQDDGTLHASTIASFSAGDTVTLNDALTAAASSGNKVYAYTNPAPRPLKITSVRSEQGDNEVFMSLMSRADYFNLANKSASGRPTQYFYDPQAGTGVLYLYPTPDSVSYEINYTYADELEVITADSQTADYPQEWMEYLVYGLAMRICLSRGKPTPAEALAIFQRAEQSLEQWDQDDASLILLA